MFSALFGKQVPECFVHTPTLKNVLQECQFSSVLYIFNFKSPASMSITVGGCRVVCVFVRCVSCFPCGWAEILLDLLGIQQLQLTPMGMNFSPQVP